MESENTRKARRNEVAYCGCYCRTCHWYSDSMRKPAVQLLELVKANFEVAGWINEKGGSSTETLKGLEILSKSACAFNAKVAVAGPAAQFVVAASPEGSSSVLNVPIFHAQTGMKMASSRTSSTALKRKDFRK